MLTGITEVELEQELAQEFDHIKDKKYTFFDQGFGEDERRRKIKHTFPRLLESFDRQTRQFLEDKIFDHFDEQEKQQQTCRIMDQGCGKAFSIRVATFDYEFMSRHTICFEGYAVGGALKQMTALGRARRNTPPAEEKKTVPQIYHFPKPANRHGVEQNVRFYGIADDLHRVMKEFPYELDLVFSDMTYMHLLAPWLAFKRTVERLAVGGVALVRTLTNNIYSIPERVVIDVSGEMINDSFLLNQLRESNHSNYDLFTSSDEVPVTTAVIRKGDEPFRTDMYLGTIKDDSGRESIQCVYTEDEQQATGLLAIDRL
ncbi:hypothetical protein J4210_04845 [Candidatus Woesearchaeota archaeon]|nr:hypothetical protein [Candidatus Woesearchaeota archaeon]